MSVVGYPNRMLGTGNGDSHYDSMFVSVWQGEGFGNQHEDIFKESGQSDRHSKRKGETSKDELLAGTIGIQESRIGMKLELELELTLNGWESYFHWRTARERTFFFIRGSNWDRILIV